MFTNVLKTKFIALILCLSLALSFVPNFVLAEEGDEPAYDGYIVSLKEGSDAEPAGNELETIVDGEIYYAETKQDIREELPSSEIESIEPNYELELTDEYIPNDPKFLSKKWQQEMIKVQEVWARGYMGQGTQGKKTPVIGIIDSGLVGSGKNPVNEKHEDIDYSNVLEGFNVCDDYTEKFTDDEVGHGTVVAGIIMATSNNGVGVAGDMPKVKIRPYRCFRKNKKGEAQGNVAYEVLCIYKAIEDDVDVINLSIGGVKNTDVEAKAIAAANKKGIIVCASSGNDGKNMYFYPAAHKKVIGVGSVDRNSVLSSFSNYNNRVDAVAPGEEIIGIGYKSPSQYCTNSQGTSFACPHVSALAAMCKSINPEINHDVFLSVLKEASTDLGTAGYDKKYGWGLINYSKALDVILSADSTPSDTVKITNVKAGKKYFKIFWERDREADYQLQYSTNSKFTKKARKTYTVTKPETVGVKISKLIPRKKYYVRMRFRINDDGEETFSKWTKTISIRTK